MRAVLRYLLRRKPLIRSEMFVQVWGAQFNVAEKVIPGNSGHWPDHVCGHVRRRIDDNTQGHVLHEHDGDGSMVPMTISVLPNTLELQRL